MLYRPMAGTVWKRKFGMKLGTRLFGAAVAAAALMASGVASAAEVNVYSARKDNLIKPILDEFTKETGIKVNLLTADGDQLLERLKNEGAGSPADMLITTDVGRLAKAKADGVLQPVRPEGVEKNVPANLRDPEGYWYGLTTRARVIFYAKDRVKPSQLSTYEDLADPKWKGKICIRSSNNIYNQSMLAGLIQELGPQKAEEWAKGIVANLARKPQGGDRDQIKAVAAGECDIAVANTYYYGGMLTGKDEAEKKAAQSVGVFWPNQKDRGAHVNISGAGLTSSAKNKAEALKLLEFMSADKAQKMYAELNQEYPVKPGVQWSDLLKSWGTFKADNLQVSAMYINQPEAVKIFDRVGWR